MKSHEIFPESATKGFKKRILANSAQFRGKFEKNFENGDKDDDNIEETEKAYFKGLDELTDNMEALITE